MIIRFIAFLHFCVAINGSNLFKSNKIEIKGNGDGGAGSQSGWHCQLFSACCRHCVEGDSKSAGWGRANISDFDNGKVTE